MFDLVLITMLVCLQTLVHPLLLKTKVRGGRIGGQVPGMEKSEGGGAIHLHHHGDGTEMHPQGENNNICMYFTFAFELGYQLSDNLETM